MRIPEILARMLVIGLALAGRVHAQSSLTNGLDAYYAFNGNTRDAVNGQSLTNYGAFLCADRFGNANRAYYFNGTSYLARSLEPTSHIDNWTITAWMKPGSLSQTEAYAVCVGYDDGNVGDGFAFGISGGDGIAGDGTNGAGSGLWGFYPGVGGASDSFAFTSTNQWCQVVMMRSSGTLMFFVNGEFMSNSQPGLPDPNRFPDYYGLEIGSGGPAHYFTGAVDDVRVYERALSVSEVQELYSLESPPPPRVTINLLQTMVPAQAVVPAFSGLSVGLNYQLQASTDLITWINQGLPFQAKNLTMIFPQSYVVSNGSQLYFRSVGPQ